MKTKNILLALIFSALFVSCKNDKNENSQKENQEQTIVDKVFKVTLDVVVKKDDNFQIYYTDKSSSDFNEKESIWTEIKGSESPQKVVFELPKDYVPTLFRLDFGVNDKQEDIKINSVQIDYFGKKFFSQGEGLANYFRPETSTKIDFKTGIIKAILKNGKRLEPALYPHEKPLGDEITKLVK